MKHKLPFKTKLLYYTDKLFFFHISINLFIVAFLNEKFPGHTSELVFGWSIVLVFIIITQLYIAFKKNKEV